MRQSTKLAKVLTFCWNPS